MEIAVELIHGGEKEVNKIKQTPFFDTTVARRCAVISADVKERLIQKILKASSFGIQLDENTDDITCDAQPMVFCRFPDIETNRIVEHYLFCQPVGVKATAETISQKLTKFFEKERLDWSKCKSVTTDGAATMQGSQKGVVKKIKQLSFECVKIHYILVVNLSNNENSLYSPL